MTAVELDTKVYVNAIGVSIELDVTEDLALAGTLKILYLKPSGTSSEWSATQYDTTKVKHITVDGDLDEEGVWTFQSWAFGLRGESVERRIYGYWE